MHKGAIVTLAAAFIAVGTISASIYQYQKEAPLRAQYQYLETVRIDFSASAQSINEVLTTFNVAGDKVEILDSLKESTSSASGAGFYVSLDDLEKSISKIESTQQNIQLKKSTLEKKSIPDKLLDLNNQILDFYSQTIVTFSQLNSDHLFAKQLLLASGPKFYIPTLTQDELWEQKDQQKIIDYYQSTKEEADIALDDLAALSVPPHFEQYYNAQVAYLTLLVNLSDNIINTLSVQNDSDIEAATQMEKAYQLLVGAKRDNETASKKLLEEKLKLVDLGQNLNKIAPIEIRKNSIEQNLDLALASTPRLQPQNRLLFAIYEQIFDKVF